MRKFVLLWTAAMALGGVLSGPAPDGRWAPVRLIAESRADEQACQAAFQSCLDRCRSQYHSPDQKRPFDLCVQVCADSRRQCVQQGG